MSRKLLYNGKRMLKSQCLMLGKEDIKKFDDEDEENNYQLL
jgi:hypothetical protein